MALQVQLPPPPWRAMGPDCTTRLTMGCSVLFFVFVILPAAAYFFIGELWSGCACRPTVRRRARLAKLRHKAKAARGAGHWDEAIGLYSQILDDPRGQLKPALAKMHFARACCHDAQGDLDAAMADADQAIALDPTLAPAYVNRAVYRRGQGRYDEAVADLDKAVQLNPFDRVALDARAFIRYLRGDFDRAVEDWQRYMHLGAPDVLYTSLWVFVARARAGQDGTAALARACRRDRGDAWPRPAGRVLLGEITPAQCLAAAGHRDPTKAREQACEAHFFIAHHHLARGDAAAARRHLQACLDTGVTDFLEHIAAQVDIARLGP